MQKATIEIYYEKSELDTAKLREYILHYLGVDYIHVKKIEEVKA